MTASFLLVGNGSYRNRGCEAIVRGTLVGLRAEFGSDIVLKAGAYASAETLNAQNAAEKDISLRTFPLRVSRPRLSGDWFAYQFNKYIKTSFAGVHSPLLQNTTERPFAALSIGGDNYSLDYGVPEHFLEMDRFLLNRKIPVFVWGASIGPFSSNPGFENDIAKHLRSLNGVFVRESHSLAYLAGIGVHENVRLVADPAFLLAGEPIASGTLQELANAKPIGINFSPLVAKKFMARTYMPWEITKADLEPFIGFCIEYIVALCSQFDNQIVFVPHVTSDSVGSDDVYVMHEILQRLPKDAAPRVHMLPSNLSAAELKWFISRCRLFVGARTHSTIAALGSAVPTLSLGYSMKARGLNEDILGTQEFCISSEGLTQEKLIQATQRLARDEHVIRRQLEDNLPAIRSNADLACRHLRTLVENGTS